MSTFAVFGMTESHAKQLARRLQPKWLRKEQRHETEEEFEARVAEAAERHLDSQRMVQVSPVFDAPPSSATSSWISRDALVVAGRSPFAADKRSL